MKWFKHLSGARNSTKLIKLRRKYGADGYAVYWFCLECVAEVLGSSTEITFELKHDAEVIGLELNVDQLRVQEIMQYMVSVNLFEDSDGVITCLKLAKHIDKKTTRNKTMHAIIDAANRNIESVPDSSDTSPQPPATVRNCPAPSELDTDREVKGGKKGSCTISSREKYETSKKGVFLSGIKLESFETFWNTYNHKKSKPRAALAWYQNWKHIEPAIDSVLVAAEREARGRPSLVATGQTPKYPEGWITERRWENESHEAQHETIIAMYTEALPEHPAITMQGWQQSEGYQHLEDLWQGAERNRNLDFWAAVFKQVSLDDFCTGNNSANRKASLPWIVIPKNLNRIVELAQ